ncbi:hypothetical protein [Neisseria yangbaofengii]|uniref:hypothetical protein n=1 Tax=Neisseria yangbaofengii TaxID=2709396 RepID=UPI0013EB593C|nr:hypothetical protein [Neisseria yangbaofengii]
MYESELKFYPCSNIQDRLIMLYLEISEKSNDQESMFWCSSDDDLSVPDTAIEIDAERLMQALAVSSRYADVLGSATIPILIHSKGYGGKIRQDKLEINSARHCNGFWTTAWFINDWTGSWYSFDTDRHWPVEKQYLLKYLEDLLILCGKR